MCEITACRTTGVDRIGSGYLTSAVKAALLKEYLTEKQRHMVYRRRDKTFKVILMAFIVLVLLSFKVLREPHCIVLYCYVVLYYYYVSYMHYTPWAIKGANLLLSVDSSK